MGFDITYVKQKGKFIMRKFKKMLSVISATIISGVCVFSCKIPMVNANVELQDKTAQAISNPSEIYEMYDEIMSSPEWMESENRAERGQMLQLSENTLKNLTTEDLIDIVVNYPFFEDVYAFDNYQDGLDILCESFNGAKELMSRDDVGDLLLKKYEKEPVIDEEQYNEKSDPFRIDKYEMLLTQPFICEQLENKELNELCYAALNKHLLKEKSSVYGDSSENMFYDILGVDHENDHLISASKKAMLTKANTYKERTCNTHLFNNECWKYV